MYTGLLLILAAIYFFAPNLAAPHHVVGVKSSADKDIRNGNFIVARPMSAQRGDIVFYEMDNRTFVRRLIALPGEVISVANGGIFIDSKPIDTTFIEKGAPILPSYDSYTLRPNQIIVGSVAIEPGAFRLIEIDKPAEMRRGELVFSAADEMNRKVFLATVVGIGYVFLLVFAPLIAERSMDPQERRYGLLKFIWYAGWLLMLAGIIFPTFLKFDDWDYPLWQRFEIILIALNLRLTSLLMYFGAGLKQSEVMSLIVGITGLASASVWARKFWQSVEFDAAQGTASPRKNSPRKTPAGRKPRPRSNNRKPRSA